MAIILDLSTEGLLVGDIVRRVEFLLNDHKNVRWTLHGGWREFGAIAE